jgi:uncharacterized protein (TIGR02145 family)
MIIKVNNSGYIPARTLNSFDLVDKDGNVYHTITIGSQEWIVENLKVTKYADSFAIPNITAGSGAIYADWFFPSKDELNAMYAELYLYGIGNLEPIAYESSSEISATQAWAIRFNTGELLQWDKTMSIHVRACRSFTSVSPSYSLRDIGPAGGFIFWKSGDNYIEASPSNQSTNQIWSNVIDIEIGITAQGTAIGTGQANTTAIIGQGGHTTSAAKLCDDLVITNGGTGWSDDTAGAYCWYNNNIINKTTYGALYNWYAVNNPHGLAFFKRGGVQENGWRIPTDTDYTNLSTYLGGDTVSGGKLKEIGLDHWTSPNTSATDQYGFKLYGAGGRAGSSGIYTVLNLYSDLWSSTGYNSTSAWGKGFAYNLATMAYSNYPKNNGFSVRCVKDI